MGDSIRILAIDPGNIQSAYCLIDENYRPLKFDKVHNIELHHIIDSFDYGIFVIEGIANYGMAVGKEVFDTCFWSGRFWEKCSCGQKHTIPRKEVKLNLCGNVRAKDSNIRVALGDRFAPGQANCGKGTKKEPGWFYGFHADVWQAYALGVAMLDRLKSKID